MTDQILSLDECARRAGIVRRTLDSLRAVGEGPAEVAISARRRGVLESDFAAWTAARRLPAPASTRRRGCEPK